MEQDTKDVQKKQPASKVPVNEPIDLVAMCWALLERWKFIAISILIGMLLFGIYHKFMVKSVYQADASIFVTNTNSVITISDLQLGTALTEDYTKIIKSRAVLKEVIKDQGLDMNFRQLGNLITVTNPTDSHIITITVTCGDKEMSRNIANSVMEIGIDQIYKVFGSNEPSVIDYSEADAIVDLTPGLLSYLEKGALAGAVLACALICIRFYLDTTLKNEEEIQKYLHMPVLSVVPYYKEKDL